MGQDGYEEGLIQDQKDAEKNMKTPTIRYGVLSKNKMFIVGTHDTINDANRFVCESHPYIVELTVTKVFVRGEDYKEVDMATL